MAGVHGGHRERVRARARSEGLESFQPHEALELLLMQVIPQRDVNPLAHELVAAFGSVDGALSAPEEALAAIPGVGARTARWLCAVGALTEAYAAASEPPSRRVVTFRQAAEALRPWADAGADRVLLLCMDRAGRLQRTAVLSDGGGALPTIRAGVEAVLRSRAASVCSAHILPDGVIPAGEAAFSRRLNRALALIDVDHMDHILFRAGRAESAGGSAAASGEAPIRAAEPGCPRRERR